MITPVARQSGGCRADSRRFHFGLAQSRSWPEIDEAMIVVQPRIGAAMATAQAAFARECLDAGGRVRVDEELRRAEFRLDAARARPRFRRAWQEGEIAVPDTRDEPEN